MNAACPLTLAYLRRLRRLYDFSTLMNENYLEHLDTLEEQAQHAGDSRIRQHQRAFFCIELMLCRAVTHVTAGVLLNAPDYVWARSREGLNEAIRVLSADRDELLASIVERSWDNFRPTRGSQGLFQDNERRLVEVYKLAYDAAVILRQSLGNEQAPLARVGRRLAKVAWIARMSPPDLFIMANELLDQSEQGAKRVWELQRK